MKRFKDVFRFVSNKQPLNKDIGYYLDDRIVGREIETSFDFLKFIGVFYKIVSIIAIFFAITTFIESLNELSNNSYYNFLFRRHILRGLYKSHNIIWRQYPVLKCF